MTILTKVVTTKKNPSLKTIVIMAKVTTTREKRANQMVSLREIKTTLKKLPAMQNRMPRLILLVQG